MKYSLLFLILILSRLSADPLVYKLDGSNQRSINDNELGFTTRSGLLIGNAVIPLEELLETELLLPEDSLSLVSLTGMAGSEIYDPLLNLYEGTNNINSDHFSQLSGKILLPKQNMSLYGLYRYEDRYSQQFDKFHKSYAEYWGLPLPMSAYGLAEDIYIKGSYQSSRSKGIFSILSYDRWGVLPGFNDRYSYRTGIQIRGGGEIAFQKFTLSALIGADKYRDQFGHFGDSLSTDPEASIGIKYQINEVTNLGAGYRHNEIIESTDFIELGIEQNFAHLVWGIDAGFYTQYGYSIDAFFQYDLRESLRFALNFQNGRSLGERKQTWLALDRPLNYHGDTISSLNGTLAVTYAPHDLPLPFSITARSELDHHPRYERIDSTNAQFNVITGSSENRSVAALGIIAKVSFNRDLFGVSIDGKIRADFLDLPELSTPGFYRINLRGGRDSYREFQINATFEHRAPVTQIRMDSEGDVVQNISTEWNSGLTINVSIPVVSPFLETRILPTIEMGAGPIRFGKEQMLRELPGANPIGPEIFLKLVGDIFIGSSEK